MLVLAIIIPYYKLTFFEATLQSLANQTDKRFKVYIGDDASSENPFFLLEKYKDKFDFIYYRFNENLGRISLTQQWERCIALSANEEWLMILGDDDVLGENVVEEFHKNLSEIVNKGITVARYATQVVNGNGKILTDVCLHTKIEKSTDFIIKKINNQVRSSLSEYVFYKDKVLKIGFKNFPLAWYSDDMAVLEFSNFQKTYTINSSIVSVRISSLSISGDSTTIKSKNKSKFKFLYFLLSQKRNCFSKSQTEILFSKIIKCYINEKKQIFYFLKISWLCLRFFWILNYFEFIKLIVCYTFEKTEKYKFNYRNKD